MKTDGYFLECSECGSYEIKRSRATINTITKTGRFTFTCQGCKREVVEEELMDKKEMVKNE